MTDNNRIGDNLIITGINIEIVEPFHSKGVDFLVIGGLAIAWYCSARKAGDMDLLVNPTEDNSQKVADILSSLDGVRNLEHGAFAKPSVLAQIKKYHNADIITPALNGPTFEELMNGAEPGNLLDIPAKIPSVENLIRMKKSAILSTEKDPNKNERAKEKEIKKHKRDIELLIETNKTT